ncbi:MAG: hypothetical protein IJ108_04025 [Eubacterium sp.]|nr:hypothetical protein [Eubacterium sp.]
MTELTAENIFQVVKNAQDAGMLELFPGLQAKMGPGERFFESLQRDLLDKYDIDQLDLVLYNLAPAIAFMAEQEHWEPAEFTAEEFFQAVKNLQTMGVFEVKREKTLKLPGSGDKFFEYYQDILVHKIGVDVLDQILYTMGQCIGYLATDAALENYKAQ